MKYQLHVAGVLIVVYILLGSSCKEKQNEHEANSIQYDLARKAYLEKRYDDSKSLFLKVDEPNELEEANFYLAKIDSIELLTLSNDLKNKKISEFEIKKDPLALAQQKIIDWKKTSTNDKMILCTAFVNEFNKLSSRHLSAIDVLNCIDEATKGLNSTNDISVGTMMTLCSQEILK